MFSSIETAGYYNRENVWVVVTVDNGKMDWLSMWETKAEAVEALREWVDEWKPEFAMVIKSPYAAAAE